MEDDGRLYLSERRPVCGRRRNRDQDKGVDADSHWLPSESGSCQVLLQLIGRG
jgi:hypothetical protein